MKYLFNNEALIPLNKPITILDEWEGFEDDFDHNERFKVSCGGVVVKTFKEKKEAQKYIKGIADFIASDKGVLIDC